jgi:hypothetical protein
LGSKRERSVGIHGCSPALNTGAVSVDGEFIEADVSGNCQGAYWRARIVRDAPNAGTLC